MPGALSQHYLALTYIRQTGGLEMTLIHNSFFKLDLYLYVLADVLKFLIFGHFFKKKLTCHLGILDFCSMCPPSPSAASDSNSDIDSAGQVNSYRSMLEHPLQPPLYSFSTLHLLSHKMQAPSTHVSTLKAPSKQPILLIKGLSDK